MTTPTLEQVGREHGFYFTASELMATQFPPPRWAVPGLIAEGLNLFVGAPKIGKSWLALGIGIAVAKGGRALDKIEVQQGTVLYAALEDHPRRLQSRLRSILGSESVPEHLHITTVLPKGQETIDVISGWLDAHPDARLVIIDVLRKITPRTDGRNAYEADYDSIGALKQLADRHGIAILVVHHTRKMADDSDVFNEVSGSTGLTGAADATLIVKRARNTAEAVLSVTGRDIIENEYALRWEPSNCTWTLLDEPVELAHMGDTRRQVLDYVNKHPGSTPKAIADGTGIPVATVQQNVRRMVKDQQLGSTGNGRYYPPDTVSGVSGVSRATDRTDTADTLAPVVPIFNGIEDQS